MTKESARMQKSHSQERLEIQDSRESRPTTRDHEVVKMPDGREFISSPRTSLKRAGALSDLPKKVGFIRRWVSSNIPGRIQDLIDLGYRPATDENGTEIAPIRGGTNKIKSEASRQENREKMKGTSLGYSSSTYIGQDTTKFVTKQN